ncbi:hypothetical protein CH063_08295 [Colletotrichum higginsianum]|uniref:Transmembrane protein n=1 Tax=Colletotrichum higginsianum (strain IMI 349063) TaxID=759273 RepID=H1V9B0_COLHI|nr:hypothetical protein CH063_08295 [Colletotrichum higginsianum]
MQQPPARLQARSPRQKKSTSLDSRFPRSGYRSGFFLLCFFSLVFFFLFFSFSDQEAFLEIPPSALHWIGRYQLLRVCFLSFPWARVPVLRMMDDDHFTTNDDDSRLRAQRTIRIKSNVTATGSMPRHTNTLGLPSLRTDSRISNFGGEDLQPGLGPIMATLSRRRSICRRSFRS